ncbi:adenylyl-sulfate kinase [Pseudomonas fluorescens]|uniref:Adenylyl-sulfate kinase n=1 Tax=Pseudomonas lactucae TaxID=2813360 RepID=A0A9X0YH76_9PSED|nr:adenylyl-sulfate kinase [Pseudomonas lactucae]OPA94043.1 adenylyl-sulfate kinase [Pseudomonas fluorescens]MBN2979501.1 adenylyl-sulfate kinase [Pseudomonas lactucae]MBN2986688.1 adenylyl-sulfate kinase [Pseudomonas lactucae]OPB12028.1 adenylyl-sulfate kinase [Pseudomonas fluorescens]OPB24056.1 adenylyl-sulfate kinase [Pseudomonas fluorescens]
MSDVAHRQNPDLHAFAFSHRERLRIGQPSRVIWLTGLSASGKSTIADALDSALQARGYMTCIIDGDSVRGGLCRDLGFSERDREENIRRVAEVARLMLEAGLMVIVALISPSAACRHHARSIVGHDYFVEVHVDVSLEIAEQRDPKGLYKKARAGQIKHFTGIDSIYEVPVCPDVHLDTQLLSVAQSVEAILERALRADDHA